MCLYEKIKSHTCFKLNCKLSVRWPTHELNVKPLLPSCPSVYIPHPHPFSRPHLCSTVMMTSITASQTWTSWERGREATRVKTWWWPYWTTASSGITQTLFRTTWVCMYALVGRRWVVVWACVSRSSSQLSAKWLCLCVSVSVRKGFAGQKSTDVLLKVRGHSHQVSVGCVEMFPPSLPAGARPELSSREKHCMDGSLCQNINM